MQRLLDRVKNISPGTIFFILISLIVFFIFLDFFVKGYVMEGTYDRRDANLPIHLVFLRAFQAFEVAQWNPFIFCGNSLFPNGIYAFFYPINWILWSFPESYLPLLSMLLLIIDCFLAAYFMRILLKEIIKDEFWATTGSISYVLSWSSMQWLVGYPEYYLMFVYVPAILYLILTSVKRSLLSNFILQTAANSLLLLGGAMELNIYAFMFIMSFVVYIGVRKDETPFKNNAMFSMTAIASFLFALMISAVRYLPFYLSTGSNISLNIGSSELAFFPPRLLMRLFLPELFPGTGEVFICYPGVFAGFLGMYAILFIWDRKTFFWKMAAVMLMLIAIGSPFTYIHYFLTLKKSLAFTRMALLVPICFSVLLCFTGKTIVEDQRHFRRFIIFSVGLFVLLLSAGLYYYFYSYQSFVSPVRNANEVKLEMMEAIVLFTVFFGLMAGALLFFRSKGKLNTIIFRATFLAVMVADLLIFAKIYMAYANTQRPFFIPEPYYKSLPLESRIVSSFEESNKNFRILGFSFGTSYSRNISSGLYNSSGNDSVPPFYVTMLYSYPYVINRSFGIYRHVGPHISPFEQRVLELTSTRFILWNDLVQEIPSSLPRYSLYNNFVVMNDDNEALYTLLENPTTDINQTVILNSSPDIPIAEGEIGGQIRLIREGLNDLTFEVISPGNTLLLLNDTYDDGWRAFIDGNKTNVMRANYAFRAVAVPSGVHKVHFSFAAKGFEEAKVISIVSLLIFTAITAIYFLRERRNRNSPAVI